VKEFRDCVAVITGAASGIGRALAQHCAAEGMKLVLADIDASALAQTAAELRSTGATVLAVPTDVSQASDVEALAQKTLETFGGAHLLFNNAGVATSPLIWETSLAEWHWILGVNLWGVIHGLHYFVPIMLKQPAGGHIVNTSSAAGLIEGPGLGAYKATKHGIVTISETLHYELVARSSNVRVSVLCPGFVDTGLADNSVRLRPNPPKSGGVLEHDKFLADGTRAGLAPDHIAECVFEAIKEEKLYILPHLHTKDGVRFRMENILNDRNPTDVVGEIGAGPK
jgi:NAD(P)-dependent dehydrogenase (short-subunit alcohol dehydrogenase family)